MQCYDCHMEHSMPLLDFGKSARVVIIKILLLCVKETMSTTMHLFTFYLESDGMSTNNDYKHFFGALSLQFC